MSLRAFRSGCNVIAYQKDDKKYGMTCAWSTMLDYTAIGMLIGSQSETGKHLSVGDIVGVSALAKGQRKEAVSLGNKHSPDEGKFEGISYKTKDSAILIENAKVQMICRVKQILYLFEGQKDRFVVLDVLDFARDKDKEYLSLEEVLPE